MVAPALNLALSELDIAALCAEHPRAGHAGPVPSAGHANRAALEVSTPSVLAVVALAALVGLRIFRERVRRAPSRESAAGPAARWKAAPEAARE